MLGAFTEGLFGGIKSMQEARERAMNLKIAQAHFDIADDYRRRMAEGKEPDKPPQGREVKPAEEPKTGTSTPPPSTAPAAPASTEPTLTPGGALAPKTPGAPTAAPETTPPVYTPPTGASTAFDATTGMEGVPAVDPATGAPIAAPRSMWSGGWFLPGGALSGAPGQPAPGTSTLGGILSGLDWSWMGGLRPAQPAQPVQPAPQPVPQMAPTTNYTPIPRLPPAPSGAQMAVDATQNMGGRGTKSSSLVPTARTPAPVYTPQSAPSYSTTNPYVRSRFWPY